MSEMMQAFLHRVQMAAAVLEDAATNDLIANVLQQTQVSQLRILIVGPTGVGRCSIANVLLRQPDLLPTSIIPKIPISISLSYGETRLAQVVMKDRKTKAIAAEQLGAFLTNHDADVQQYECLHFRINADLLKKSEFRLESIQSQHTPGEWKELLAITDYTLFVLKATALLSEQERRFIKDILLPYFGLERVAIVLNQIDLVPEEEREEVMARVQTFLGSFATTPLLIEFSAAQAKKRMDEENILGNGRHIEDALLTLVQYDLITQHTSLKSAALRQAAELCLTEVARVAAHRVSLVTVSKKELVALRKRCDTQSEWLQGRIAASQQKVDTFINTLVKGEFFLEIDQFSADVRAQLPGEINAVDNINQIKRHLPGYMEQLWSEFFERQTTLVRSRLDKEMQAIYERVVADLRELLGDLAPNFAPMLETFDPTPGNFLVFIAPKKEKHQANTLATGLQVGGLFVLGANIPLGLTAIGVGQLIRKAYRQEIANAEKKAMLDAATQASYDLESLIKEQVTVHFAKICDSLKEAVADLYSQGLDRLLATLDEDIQSQKAIEARSEQLEQLQQITIPDLKQQLQQAILML